MRKNLILGAAAGAALVLSSGSLALASNDDGGGSHRAQAGAVSDNAVTPRVFACDGGAQKARKNRIVNTPFTFAENPGVDIPIPGAAVGVGGPLFGSDIITVTFSAETQLTGSSSDQDWIGLEVHLDGVPIQPFTAVGDVMALSGSPTWNMHTATFCARIGPGNHVVRAFTNLVDNGTNDVLGGWIDDYTLSVERSE